MDIGESNLRDAFRMIGKLVAGFLIILFKNFTLFIIADIFATRRLEVVQISSEVHVFFSPFSQCLTF